jgi:hypothetical protein
VVGIDLFRREPKLDNYVVIVPGRDGGARLNTLDSSKVFGPGELKFASLRQILGKTRRAIVQGTIDDRLAMELNEAGVYFVRDTRDFIANPFPEAEKYFRLIMIAAKGKTEDSCKANRSIYEQAYVSSIEKATEIAESAGALLVQDREGLEKALKQVQKDGERPLVFFHNADGQIRFADGKALNLGDFVGTFGKYRVLPIACSTFDRRALLVRTTADLYVIDFAKAYKASMSKTPTSPTPPDEFLNTLGAEYAKASGKRRAVIIAGLGAGAGAPAVLVAILRAVFSDDKKKKAAEETQNDDDQNKNDDREGWESDPRGDPAQIDSYPGNLELASYGPVRSAGGGHTPDGITGQLSDVKWRLRHSDLNRR